MGQIFDKFTYAYRDFVTNGIPASGPHDPEKVDIRAIALPIEAGIAAAALSGTDLNAAMQLVAPLLTSAQAAQAASEAANVTLANAFEEIPQQVAQQLDGAVASATAQAGTFAAAAGVSASTAEAVVGPTYSSVSDGVAATVEGGSFAVSDGAGKVTIYRKVSGAAVSQRTLATTDYLAGDAGATAVGFKSTKPGSVSDTVAAKLNGLPMPRDAGVNLPIDSLAIGVEALVSVTSGVLNTAFGYQALKENTAGSENTGFGYMALSQVTGGTDPVANFNSGFGSYALSKLTTGYKNAAFGRASANWLTTGYHNTALGYGAFHWARTAVNCTAVGFEAAHGGDGSVNFSAQGITAIGFRALYNCTANFNTAIGTAAGFSTTTGERNVAVGVNALNTNVVGSDNVAVGYFAGFANTGSGNIFVGTNADAAAGLANVTVIGSGLTASASNTLLLGNGQTVIPGSTSADFGTQAKPWNYGIFGNSVLAHCGRAMPTGGTTGAGVLMSSTPNFGIFFGSGAPTLTAARGSLYLRSDGSGPNNRIYVNSDNGTGWTALTTAS